MSVSGINFSGLSSGLDTESIISKYLIIARQPETIYKAQQTDLQNKQAVYGTISAKLIAFQLAAQSLNKLRSFNAVTAATSDATIATGTAATGTQAGQYNLTVNSLATAQVLSSTAQASQTAALGFSGQIIINGKAVTIKAGDNLQNVAADINGASAGVTASIIQPTAGQFYLAIGSNNSGVQGAISLSDSNGGTFLSGTLGVLDSSGATSLKNPIGTTGAASNLFSDSTTSVGTLLGLTNPASGTVVVAGQAINFDLAHDSLSALASKITAAGIPGVSAQVVSAVDPVSGSVKQQLQITGTQDFTDANGVLNGLGVTQSKVGAGHVTTAAADASFTLNGLPANRATNSFSDAVSGLTINLVKTGSATLTVASDTATIKGEINDYVNAFNDIVATVHNNSQYDSTTKTGGPLLGDTTAESLVDSLTQGVTDAVANVDSSKVNNLAQIGVTLGTDGTLSIDDSKLTAALGGNLSDIGRLFRADGVTSSSAVTFVSTDSHTKPSPKTGYAVSITQPATQAVFTAATAQTGTLAQDETLTFGGGLFGTDSAANPLAGGHSVQLSAGSSLQDVVTTLNADAVVSKHLNASIVNGKLTLTSKSYGSTTQFYVGSGVADQKNGSSSGVGATPQKAAGLDVAGTINGEAATGVGQYLTGSKVDSKGNAAGFAHGLQLLISATAPGSYGTVAVSTGVASFVDSFATAETDGYSGALTNATTTAKQTYDDVGKTISDLETRISAYETNLRRQFTNLESVVSQLKAAGNSLTAFSNASTSSSSSK